ncbi:hypothetical protein CK203_115262 [Vitis vinifera]|uniref:Uncharacterized protein n=1 Tax=Vitis vinifera TaxID=29760 RepID=A0A438CSZ6_VITVI|nr:hypothetical protein CK203_115262 [Vitis vinifera]
MREPSPLINPIGTRGSACMEVMTTLNGSIPSPWRHAEGCIPSNVPPPPLLSQSVPHPAPYLLHSQVDVTSPPIVAPIPTLKDAQARMDKLEQRMRQMRFSDGAISWDDFDGAPVASLSTYSTGLRSPKHYQTFGQPSRAYYPQRHVQYRPPRPMAPTYLHQTLEPVFIAHVLEDFLPYTLGPEPHRLLFLSYRGRHACTPARATALQDGLHCSYHQGPGHDMDHCSTLRHAIQDLIDQGLVNLGQPSVTTNPLSAHSMHAVPPPSGKPIVLDDGYEVDTVGSQTSTPFSLISD